MAQADGVVWHKPSLGVVSFNGSSSTNIVYPPSENYQGGYQVGNVFYDTKIGVPQNQRWKHVTQRSCINGSGLAVLSSADGIRWDPTVCASTGVTHSDTFNIAFFDDAHQSYVGYIRIDNTEPNPHGTTLCSSQPALRRVGRCEFAEVLGDWGAQCNNQNASVALTFDATDPTCLDYYTSSVTKYGDVYVGFPSAFSHTTFAYGDNNDGLVDIRFIVSRDGKRFQFVDAPDGRAPWIPLGLNTCDELVPAVADPANMQWCAKTATLERTSVAGAALYMAQGVVTEGSKMHVYYGAEPMSHGGYESIPAPAQQQIFRRQQILRAELRIDGWVSLDAPYEFAGMSSHGPSGLPSFTTRGMVAPSAAGCLAMHARNWSIAVPPPAHGEQQLKCGYALPGGRCVGLWPALQRCTADKDCGGTPCAASAAGCCDHVAITCNSSGLCGGGPDGSGVCARKAVPSTGSYVTGGLALLINVQTSVAGLLYLELQEQSSNGEWSAVHGFSLAESDPIRGNFVRKAASWRRGNTNLSELAGKTVRIVAAVADAKLFSFTLGCSDR